MPPMSPSASPGRSTENTAKIKTVSAEASEQEPAVEVDEGTAAPNPPIASKDPVSEPSSRIVAVELLINLEEESEAAVDPTAI